jgi:hypothetical protein
MKKLYTLFFLSLAFVVNAQVTNGDLETWTDTSTPASFSPSPFTASVTQESSIKHGGMYSAKHTTPTLPASPTSVKIQNETAVVTPGVEYTISYWYLDNTDAARTRPWCYWLDAANKTIVDNEAEFRPSTYSTDSPDWQEYKVTVTAPATAVKLRFEMRSYAEGTIGGGSIYYDDMSVTSNLSVKQNSISGLNVYPNPVVNGKLFITTDSNATKSIVIFDVLGKQVLSANVNNQALNVSRLNQGVYIIKITEEGLTSTRKLVIK